MAEPRGAHFDQDFGGSWAVQLYLLDDKRPALREGPRQGTLTKNRGERFHRFISPGKCPKVRRRAQVKSLSDERGCCKDSFAEIRLMNDLGFVAARLDHRHFAREGHQVDVTIRSDRRSVVTANRPETSLCVKGGARFG